jgi:hypothetical protein
VAKHEALLIRIRLSDNDLGSAEDDDHVSALENALESALAEKQAGYCDGHEFGCGWATIFCYGQSVTRLFEAAVPSLLQAELRDGSCAVKQYGGPGSRQEVVDLRAGAG